MTQHAPRGPVPPVDSAANLSGGDVIGNKLDTTDGTSLVSLNKEALLYAEHVPLFSGEIWYVSPTGDDADSGETPHDAFLTIGHAIGVAAAGDAIVTRAGTYAEAVDLSLESMEFWPEIGTILAPAVGIPLTISANYCKVWCPGGSLRCNPPAGGTGVFVSGAWCYVHDVRVPCGSSALIGFSIAGAGSEVLNCRCSNPLTYGFEVAASMVKLWNCGTAGSVGDSSTGFDVTNLVDRVRIIDCDSSGHETAGFSIEDGTTNIIVKNCVSGAGDGRAVDYGTDSFLDILEHDASERHEHVWPSPLGEGVAAAPVTVDNQINDETGATNVQNYWGDTVIVLDVLEIANPWYWKGVNFFATSAADDQRFAFYRVTHAIRGHRNGGNAWDEGATVLTLTDAAQAAQFAVDDLVWIRTGAYHPDGEIVTVTDVTGAVVTIARNVESSGRTGLHWDYTTNAAGDEQMFLCHRDDAQYHATSVDYSATGARDFARQMFGQERRMAGSDGVIARMINGTDNGVSSCAVTIIWSD